MVVSKTLPGQIQGLDASFLQVPSNCPRKVKPWARRQEITTIDWVRDKHISGTGVMGIEMTSINR